MVSTDIKKNKSNPNKPKCLYFFSTLFFRLAESLKPFFGNLDEDLNMRSWIYDMAILLEGDKKMKSKKISAMTFCVIAMITISVLSGAYFVGAQIPESSAEDTSITAGSNNMNILPSSNQLSFDEEIDIAWTGDPNTPSTTMAWNIDRMGETQIAGEMSQEGITDFYNGSDQIAQYHYDSATNISNLMLWADESYPLGNVRSDINDNEHTVIDNENGFRAFMVMQELGHFEVGDADTSGYELSNVTIDIMEMYIRISFPELGGIFVDVYETGQIDDNTGTPIFLPGDTRHDEAVMGFLNITVYDSWICIDYLDVVIFIYDGYMELNYGVFRLTWFNIWTWAVSGYVDFIWMYNPMVYITFVFYLSWYWTYYGLIYVFIWDIYDIKLEYFYYGYVYCVWTWWLLTIELWYYIDIIIWEFKFIWNVWIIHWQIQWNTTIWIFWWWIYYVHWTLPVVVLRVPIIYIPPVVDIDVYKEEYDAENDQLTLIYWLKDLYGHNVTGATVTATVEGSDKTASELGHGLYQVTVTSLAAQSDPIDIEISATVPNVALVDSLNYELDIDEASGSSPGGNDIPGYSTIGMLLISTVSLLALAFLVKKRQK